MDIEFWIFVTFSIIAAVLAVFVLWIVWCVYYLERDVDEAYNLNSDPRYEFNWRQGVWYFHENGARGGPYDTRREAVEGRHDWRYHRQATGQRPFTWRVLDAWKDRCKLLDPAAGGDEMKLWTYKEIVSHGRLYLSRMYFTRNVYLHYYHTNDGDSALHDHPWRWAFSIVLWGWYEEDRLLGLQPEHTRRGELVPGQALTRRVRRRWFNLLMGTSWHRVRDVRPGTMTLFITGPYFKSWGFMDSEGNRMHWKDHIAQREAE
jgi:hypothetical protein